MKRPKDEKKNDRPARNTNKKNSDTSAKYAVFVNSETLRGCSWKIKFEDYTCC